MVNVNNHEFLEFCEHAESTICVRIRAVGSILNQSGQETWSVGVAVAKLDYKGALPQ